MTYASIKNIETALMRELTVQEARYAPALLAQAEQLISDRVPSLDNLCASDTDFAATVAQIQGEAVARVYRAHRVGEGTGSYRMNIEMAAQILYISEDEAARLRRNSGFSARDGFLQLSMMAQAPAREFIGA